MKNQLLDFIKEHKFAATGEQKMKRVVNSGIPGYKNLVIPVEPVRGNGSPDCAVAHMNPNGEVVCYVAYLRDFTE